MILPWKIVVFTKRKQDHNTKIRAHLPLIKVVTIPKFDLFTIVLIGSNYVKLKSPYQLKHNISSHFIFSHISTKIKMSFQLSIKTTLFALSIF